MPRQASTAGMGGGTGGKISHDQAAVMLAVLAARCDGAFTAKEESFLLERLEPPLTRLGMAGKLDALDRLQTLVESRGTDAASAAILAALPKRDERIEAVTVALDVALADGRLDRLEADHVATLAVLAGLDEHDFAAVVRDRLAAANVSSPKAQAARAATRLR